MKIKLITVAAIITLSACDSNNGENNADVAISNGKLQCQDNALPLETTKNYLLEAGINVVSEHCGIDNTPVTTVCGATANQIHVFTIKESDLSQAENIGFIEVSKLEEGYQTVNCQEL